MTYSYSDLTGSYYMSLEIYTINHMITDYGVCADLWARSLSDVMLRLLRHVALITIYHSWRELWDWYICSYLFVPWPLVVPGSSRWNHQLIVWQCVCVWWWWLVDIVSLVDICRVFLSLFLLLPFLFSSLLLLLLSLFLPLPPSLSSLSSIQEQVLDWGWFFLYCCSRVSHIIVFSPSHPSLLSLPRLSVWTP